MSTTVLLHGVGLDKSIWNPMVPLLNGPVVALDLPGHGTQPALEHRVTLNEFADDVVSRLPEGKIHLVGFSLGGLTAMNIAARYPEKIESLIALSAVCDRTPAEQEAVLGRLATAGDDFEVSVERAIDRWYPLGTEFNALFADQTREILLANNIDSYLHAYQVFATGDQQVLPLLNKITAPTLAITGELDPGSTPDMSYRIQSHVPHCRVIIIDGAHHMVPLTHSDYLAKVFNEFHTTC